MAKGCNRAALPIDVAPGKRGSFGIAESGETEKLNKVRALLRRVAVLLFADTRGNHFELLKCRSFANRFVELDRLNARRWRCDDDAVVNR